jgi:hypothetical protein
MDGVICRLCGRTFVALGVHLRHKHAVDPDDYRDEYGILRGAPLVSEALSQHLSAAATRRLEDEDYKAEVADRCRENAKALKGRPGPGMTKQGKAALAGRNSAANAAYLNQRASDVAPLLGPSTTVHDICRSAAMSPGAVKKVLRLIGTAAAGGVAERAKRAAATQRAKAMARVRKVEPLLETTKSAAEMCRQAGISLKTYKNWLRSGLIKRHPNGRNFRERPPMK